MIQRLAPLACALLLGACASAPPPPPPASLAPPGWHAPLPHGGALVQLQEWWRAQGDPLLAELVTAAQAESPTLAAAQARIAQARAQRVAAGAALAPTVDAAASVVRASQQSELPLGTTAQGALQAAWEIDLFGARRGQRDAAQARYEGAQAGWHDARVSVAAETARLYYGLRACLGLQAIAQQDAASRADTARLTELTAKAGFQAPATAALARASAAEGAARATQQRAQCDVTLKALVALSAMDEDKLRARLAAQPGVAAPALAFDTLPAQTLTQRPDVFTAEREVLAAAAEIGAAQAQRLPRLTLQGSVGAGSFRSAGQTVHADTWSIGPLALTLPVFDGGTRRANVDAARAQYDSALAAYRSTVRNAVREVEEALVNLAAAAAREADARTALDGFRTAYTATDNRYRNGMASLLELEDARRSRLAAENAVIQLDQERSNAWVALYRAAGGGWTRNQ